MSTPSRTIPKSLHVRAVSVVNTIIFLCSPHGPPPEYIDSHHTQIHSSGICTGSYCSVRRIRYGRSGFVRVEGDIRCSGPQKLWLSKCLHAASSSPTVNLHKAHRICGELVYVHSIRQCWVKVLPRSIGCGDGRATSARWVSASGQYECAAWDAEEACSSGLLPDRASLRPLPPLLSNGSVSSSRRSHFETPRIAR